MGDNQGPWVDTDDEAPEKEEATAEETNEEESEEVGEGEEKEESEEKSEKFVPKNLPEDEEWDFVDIKDPKIQKKFNRIYSQVKHTERTNKQLMEDNRKLMERLQKMETRFDDKEDNDNRSALQSKLDKLTEQRKAAVNEGDDEKAYELTEEIIELKRELKAPKPKKKEAAKEEPKEDEAQDAPQFSEEDKETLANWGFERDNRGNFVRPWFDQSHPDHITAKKMAEAILEEVGDVPVAVGEVLEELERRMNRYYGKGTRKAQSAQSAEPAKKASGPKLSQEQIHVATRMFPEKSKEDAIKAYLGGFDDDASW